MAKTPKKEKGAKKKKVFFEDLIKTAVSGNPKPKKKAKKKSNKKV